jgi:hypothetical protein
MPSCQPLHRHGTVLPMHVKASRIFPAAALLLASASLIAQQAAPSQSAANPLKKHPAGVKYQSIPVQRADQTSPKPQPSTASPETDNRKSGAIHAADFDHRQAGAPLKGVGTASHPQADAAANKGIGSAGIPGKAASQNGKTDGAPIKGAIYKRTDSKN